MKYLLCLTMLFVSACATTQERMERLVRQPEIQRVDQPPFRNDMDTLHYRTVSTVLRPVGLVMVTPFILLDALGTPVGYGLSNLVNNVDYPGYYRSYGVLDLHVEQVLAQASELHHFDPENVSVAFVRRGQKVPEGYRYIVDMTPVAQTLTGGTPDWTTQMVPGTEFYFENPFIAIPEDLVDRAADQLFWQMVYHNATSYKD